ncbi:MAG: hypothetical protein ACC618_01760 [Patescibacteria group bacterium]
MDFRTFFYLERTKLKRFLKIFTNFELAKILVIGVSFLIAIFLATGTYFFSKNIFSFLKFYPDFLVATVNFTYLSLFFLIFILITFSSIISAINTLFVQDDDNLLLSAPMGSETVFASRFINLIFFSSWPVFVFGLPVLAASYSELSFNLFGLMISFLALLLVLILSSLLAVHVSLIITSFAGRLGKRIIGAAAIIALPAGAWWVATFIIPPNFFATFRTLEVYQLDDFIKTLPINSELLPSTWAANTVISIQKGYAGSFVNLGKLVASSFILTISGFLLVKKTYYLDLAKARVGQFIAGPQDIATKTKSSFFLRLPGGIMGAFLEKDIRMFSRDQAEVFQAAFIFFIGLLYFILLGRIPLDRITRAIPFFSASLLISINVIVVSFIITIISLRFVFPAISLEGQSAWLVWSAPFSKKKLYWQKFFSGFLLLSLFAILASFVSTFILELGLIFFFVQISVFLAATLAITSISLGLGTIFPNFEEKNPEKLSTSFGGILATFLSLLFILVTSTILFSYSSAIYSFLVHAFIWVLAIGITIVFSLLSLPKLGKYEF